MQFNVADLFESVVDAVPDRPAIVCGQERLTFAQLDARANRFAHALAARGVKAGDHVGLYLYNSVEFLEAMLGAFKLRAVPININYRYVEDELRFLFDNADLVALVYPRELGARVAAVAPQVAKLRLLIAVEDGSKVDRGRASDYETLLATASRERGFPARAGDDHYVIYTGGTTGMPRGVMWRHEDVFFAGLQGGNPGGAPIERPEELAGIALGNSDPLTFLPAAPFIHGAAQWAALIGLFGGGKVVIVPGWSFDAAIAARLIEAERVNTIILVGDAMARPLGAGARGRGGEGRYLVARRHRFGRRRPLRHRERGARARLAGDDDPQQLRRHRDRPSGDDVSRLRSEGSPDVRERRLDHRARRRSPPDGGGHRRDGKARAARPDPDRVLQGRREDGGDVRHHRRRALGHPR